MNKQYEKAEYEALKEKIIAHMKGTQEWGEFFPVELSPFPYNLTIAQSFFPLTEAEVKAKGLWWLEFQPPVKGDASDKNSKNCKTCQRLFKLIPQELSFYQQQNLPHPENCFYCRHMQRFHLRNPRKLWERNCQNCETKITSSYASDRAEKVYCEPCYLNSLT